MAIAKGTLTYSYFNMNWQVYDDVLEEYTFWESGKNMSVMMSGNDMCNYINSSLGWFGCKATREYLHDTGAENLVVKDQKLGAKAV